MVINMEKEVKFSVQMTIKTMYSFLMYHGYHGFAGIANLVLSGGAIGLLIAGVGKEDSFARLMLVLIALLFTVINPIYLLYKAAKQVKLTPMFLKPLNYVVNEQGILVSQETEKLLTEWEEVIKVTETKQAYYIYLSLTRSFLFPKESLGDQEQIFREILRKEVDSKKCRLK